MKTLLSTYAPFLLAVLLTFVVAGSYGQNLVKNKGFESYTILPNGLGQFDHCEDWSVPLGSISDPDFYHYFGNVSCDLPETPAAIVTPNSGQAVMGMIAAGNDGSGYREYLSTELLPASSGDKYKVSFYITNGDITPSSNAGLGASHFGVHFSQDALVQTGFDPIILTPTFVIDTVFFDRDWVRFEFNIEATSQFRFMTLGIFEDDASIDVRSFSANSPHLVYYFLDDLSVDPMGDPAVDLEDNEIKGPQPGSDNITIRPEAHIPNGFTPNHDGINDVFLPVLDFDVEDYSLKIFNRWGELIFESAEASKGWTGLDHKGNVLPTGVYLWSMTYTSKHPDSLGSIIEREGHITLLY